MPKLRFIKMEGCRNDYIFLDGGLTSAGNQIPEDAPCAAWSQTLSDRHSGIGGDGLILLRPGRHHAVGMRMWNADGSEGRLCLNGLRCAAKYTAESTPAGDRFTVETISGDRPVRVIRDAEGRVSDVEVMVGVADFRRDALPALGSAPEIWGDTFQVGTSALPGYGVSVGNPHLVLPVENDLDAFVLENLEPLSNDERFPEGMNVHVFAEDGGQLVMRTWERGTGPTLACGSGAVAVFAVAHRLGLVGKVADVRMPGGTVRLEESGGGVLRLLGPAREVFRGEVWVD